MTRCLRSASPRSSFTTSKTRGFRSSGAGIWPRGSTYVELPGKGHIPAAAEAGPVLDEAERFLSGAWDAGGWEGGEPDRVLATVLFTDIVGSTAKASELGDAR